MHSLDFEMKSGDLSYGTNWSLFLKFNVLFYKIPLIYMRKFTKTLVISLRSIYLSFGIIFGNEN